MSWDGGDVPPAPAKPVCASDRIRVYPVRNGWRHDTQSIKELRMVAGQRWP